MNDPKKTNNKQFERILKKLKTRYRNESLIISHIQNNPTNNKITKTKRFIEYQIEIKAKESGHGNNTIE